LNSPKSRRLEANISKSQKGKEVFCLEKGKETGRGEGHRAIAKEES